MKLIRSAKNLLNSVLLNDMMNLQSKDFKKEEWCYDSIILNKEPWQRHVTENRSESFFNKKIIDIIDSHDKSIDCEIIKSYSDY